MVRKMAVNRYSTLDLKAFFYAIFNFQLETKIDKNNKFLIAMPILKFQLVS